MGGGGRGVVLGLGAKTLQNVFWEEEEEREEEEKEEEEEDLVLLSKSFCFAHLSQEEICH